MNGHADFFPTDPGVKIEDLEADKALIEDDENYEPDFEVSNVRSGGLLNNLFRPTAIGLLFAQSKLDLGQRFRPKGAS